MRGMRRLPPMPKSYDPLVVESFWRDASKIAPTMGGGNRERETSKNFSMLLPPPNITGTLHLGHALTIAIEDAFIRWKRMQGYDTIWVPGLDHAGIATQVVVEKNLKKTQNQTRHDIGREKFVDEVWEWHKTYGGTINEQLRLLGGSLDWDNSMFTMDEDRVAAVNEAFVRLYEDGLVYRDTRLVNWCSALKTAISDIELDHVSVTGGSMLDIPGKRGEGSRRVKVGALYKIAYEFEDGSLLWVETTRPETIFGDTALAIHPQDDRFKHLHGRTAKHPITQDRVSIVCDDELVNPLFGTGIVKVTPAHDHNDYKCGLRHGLEQVNILDNEGHLIETSRIPDSYKGMDRFDARDKVVEELNDLGRLGGVKDHDMTLGLCSRSGDIIEPLLIPQWYIKMKTLAEKAAQRVRNGEVTIRPERMEKVWFQWLDNIEDWCVSRQLWWGHRIPAFRVLGEKEDEWVVARSQRDAETLAHQQSSMPTTVERDDDVLDTWFSSALLPITAFGWPDIDAKHSQVGI